jgi:hypothetical protein
MIANFMKPDSKLKRINGLDPAKPLFVGVDLASRLDEGDAEFVEYTFIDFL